jgi:hypothetical protein
MQGQRRHKKQKYEHDSQLHEKHENQSPELLLIRFKEMRRPRCPRVPKKVSDGKIEQGKYNADDKCPEEKVPEKNDLFVFHIATLLQLLATSKKLDQ